MRNGIRTVGKGHRPPETGEAFARWPSAVPKGRQCGAGAEEEKEPDRKEKRK